MQSLICEWPGRPELSLCSPSREGLGSFFGTLGGAVKDLDPTKAKYRDQPKPSPEKPNFKTNPSKTGTGYG